MIFLEIKRWHGLCYFSLLLSCHTCFIPWNNSDHFNDHTTSIRLMKVGLKRWEKWKVFRRKNRLFSDMIFPCVKVFILDNRKIDILSMCLCTMYLSWERYLIWKKCTSIIGQALCFRIFLFQKLYGKMWSKSRNFYQE